MSKFYSLVVSKVVQNTPKAVTVFFDIPQDLKQQFSFTAGQYITLRKEIDGKDVRRAYSVCTSPTENEFAVGIKKVPNGLFSTFSNELLRAGDTLEVMPPEGRFVLENNWTNIAAIAAGSGITPILSIIKTHLGSDDNHKAVLVYGNKSVKETMFYTEIEDLQQQFEGRFHVVYTFTSAKEENALFGRIDESTVNFTFKNKYKELDFDQYFICGPEEMILLASDTLKTNGVAEEAIKYELFTASTTEEVTAGATEGIADGKTEITVMIDDEETTFVADASKFLLDAVMAEDLDPPYSCQGGVCSSCIAKVTEGEATMVKNQILTDSEVKEGLILTCQAHAKTAQIKLDYDDV